MKKLCLLVFVFAINTSLFAHNVNIYPTHWWVGMKNPKVQLMIHATNVGSDISTVTVAYPGVTVEKVNKVENKNYLFVDLNISPSAKPGIVKLMGKGRDAISFDFELKARRQGKGTAFAQGVNSSDFIYLLMPDRFSNGDPTNDRIPGMKDPTLNRDSIFHRHGGDLQGVINHLDYIQELGATTLWMTPVIMNDEPDRTEHGYKPTDHYTIDPRYGGDKVYKQLSDELHRRGMKLIQDIVYNHVGISHITIQDMPMKDWVHQWPSFTRTSYKDQPLFDPYASVADKTLTRDGWFEQKMPDLNQNNPYVANYLIQNAIWCVEEFGVDGWRIDTYIYNDPVFMNRCNQALYDEYPSITTFGETWVHGVISQAYHTRNNLNVPFKSNLKGVTDFQTNMYGIVPALTQDFGWTEGVNRLYSTLAQDIIYKNPMDLVIFLDNHDLSRFLSLVKEDEEKLKMGIAWLLTCRGIPQLYYGTEILMKGVTNPDGFVRLDFKGGWQQDKENKFTAGGRTANEEEVFKWTKTLGNFRKTSSAIKTGKMMQYVPVDGLYVYFRYDDKQTVMCVMNTGKKDMEIDFSKYAERTNGFTQARSITSGSVFKTGDRPIIPANRMWVFEMVK